MNKLRIGVMCGGQSTEHEISLKSAQGILENMDRKKYDPVLIYIHKDGGWSHYPVEQLPEIARQVKTVRPTDGIALAVVPGKKSGLWINAETGQSLFDVDVVFPILHGTNGEDGTIQGLIRILDIACVGTDVLGSAVGMDKDVTKRLLTQAGIPNAKSICVMETDRYNIFYEDIIRELGKIVFVKPASLGSSVGINKVKSLEQFDLALAEAFKYDEKILIEEYIQGREIECSVLGNEDPTASLPGEIVINQEFYSYAAKYLDSQAASLHIPAQLSENIVEKIQSLALRTYQVLCCQGMARVDFFLTAEQKLYINEINTIPGFTPISMYPKMWEASGLSYSRLIDKLIELALDRHRHLKKLMRNFSP